jgi:hypothetical protein
MLLQQKGKNIDRAPIKEPQYLRKKKSKIFVEIIIGFFCALISFIVYIIFAGII